MTTTGQPAPPAEDQTLAALRRALGGTYDVERQLGAGGMGSVYLGRDRTLDRAVAIKVIAPELAATAALRERFLREARTVARLRHPNIVAVYAAGESEGVLYFVMEYVPGESLRDRLARAGRYDDAGAVTALRDLARALAYAHGQGIIHRDVKPENVQLDAESGRAMLMDFGVAGAISGGGDERMTGTGFVVGSPRYMSPEQAAGERELDGRSDVYSLGLVGYEMFAGEPAMAGGSAASIIMRQITERPAPLVTRNDHVPPAVAAVIERALEKKPEDRWATAGDMADALESGVGTRDSVVGVTKASPRSPGPESRQPAKKRLLARVLALVVVAVLAGAWWAFGSRGGVPRGVDPRKSYLVAPFDVLSPDPQLAWLREGSVSMLSLDLAQWRDLTVVDYERGLDLQRDLKLDGARIGLEDAHRMARRAGVWTVVIGRITGTPDSTLVVANLYDVASGRKLDEAQRGAPRGADPRALFDALAHDLLDLAGAPANMVGLAKSITGSVQAYRDYLEGMRALNRWQLPRADSLFGAAVAADSTFALAYYKRALAMGWWKAGDTAQMAMLRQATRNAGRLPARERALLDAYAAFANAMYGGQAPDSVRLARFAAAQRMYAAIVAHDSSDAEGWYGLGDAYYHNTTGDWSDSLSRDHWTKALAAFDRTLTLDSTFHLAYSHKVSIYQNAAGPQSPLVLDGVVLRTLRDPATRQAFAGARLAEAKARAQQLAVRDARAWAAADPVPTAFFSLANAYLPAHWDSAAAALDAAVRTLGPRAAGTLPFARALVLARTDPVAGGKALHDALAQTDSASLVTNGGVERFSVVMTSAQAAGMVGAARDVDATLRLAAAIQPTVPGTSYATLPLTRWWGGAMQLAMGAPPATVRPAFDAGLAALDTAQGRFAEGARLQSVSVPYLAFVATRDPRYGAAVRRWRGAQAQAQPWPELDALDALVAGDSARARQLTRSFPSPDSVRAAGNNLSGVRWVTRAEVLAALGDPRRAVAMYEVLDPTRLNGDGGLFDPGLTLYARSFAARARLYETLGERDKAAAAYERFIALWQNADPAFQSQVRDARAALGRVREARPGQAVAR